MHGEYKEPGGKLVVADIRVAAGVLSQVQISGDFFLEPDSALDAMNEALKGQPTHSDAAALARIVAPVFSQAQAYGITPEGVGEAVWRALQQGEQHES